MSRTRYYRDGKEIDEREALDPRTNCVLDGVTMHTSVTLTDGLRNPDGFRRLSDAECAGHRPGFRLPPPETGLGDSADAAAHALRRARADRQSAYDEYQRSLVTAYKSPSSVESFSDGRSDALSSNDAALSPRHRALLDYERELTSAWRSDGKRRKPDRDEDDEETNQIEDSRRSPDLGRPPRVDAAELQQKMADHKNKMAALYSELDLAAQERWRTG